MRLEKIELHGFKSFANKTIIQFPKPIEQNNKGITTIVGPNGSGKSNISDALRWVMGEQSVKNLRGKKSPDIIFSGSETKTKMGMAEVSLFFNNENKIAPIDYTEINITRRIYRDGESEYILNNNIVRLQDIIMLLAKCNVGQKSYGIIGQGMITQIINATPVERKLFFDEATGIRHYQIKCDQSCNKLKRTQENLSQCSQIIIELEPRLKSLKRQVQKLQQRKQIEQELKNSQFIYYSKLQNDLLNEKNKFEQLLITQNTEATQTENILSFVQNEIQKLSSQNTRQDIYAKLQNEYNELIFQKNKYSQELATIKGKTNLEYSKLGKQNLSWLELKEDEILHKLTIAQNDLTKFKTIQNNSPSSQNELNNKIHLHQNTIQKLNEIEDLLNKIKYENKNNFDFIKNNYSSLLQYKNNFKGIIGTISELGKTKPEYSLALEVCAGKYIDGIVTDNENTAKECINFLREQKLGIATFLPLNKIKGNLYKNYQNDFLKINGVIGYAIDLISFNSQYDEVFSFIFGNTLVVNNIETAKIIGIKNERMVTLLGDLIEKSGVMKGGYRRPKLNGGFLPSTITNNFSQNDLSILETKKIELLNTKNLLEQEINKFKIEIEINKTKQQLLLNNINSLSQELNSIKTEITYQKTPFQNNDEFLLQIEFQKNELLYKIEKLDENLLLQRKKIDEFNTNEEEKNKKLFELQNKSQETQQKLNSINIILNTYKIELAKIDTKLEDLTKEIIEEIGSIYELKQNQNLQNTNNTENVNTEILHQTIHDLKQKLNTIGGIDTEVLNEYQEVSQRYEFMKNQIIDLEKALTDTKKIVKELNEIIKNQFDSSFLKINKAFDHFFKKLFNGGTAKLKLIQQEENNQSDTLNNTQTQEKILDENGNEIIHSTTSQLTEEQEQQENELKKENIGIEIFASPKHKKITNMNMLSGGEKTMTAIALISAIILNNAPPFVFLDEVDAALDETNSQLLCNILKELSQLTQFIIITHNRVIMHCADILYGVAMSNDGVTKLMSLNIQEAEKMIIE